MNALSKQSISMPLLRACLLRAQSPNRDIPFFVEGAMARPSNLASMSVDSLLKLRDQIGAVLGRKTDDLKKQLAQISGGGDVGKKAGWGSSGNGRRAIRKTKGRKVAPKYRNPKTGETYAGRGAMAGWLKAELKAGKKLGDFLIKKPSKVAASRKRSAAKKSRRKRK